MERLEDSESSLVINNGNSLHDKSSPNIALRDQSKKLTEFKKSMACDNRYSVDINSKNLMKILANKRNILFFKQFRVVVDH